jgi:hypothetical protein
MQLGKERVNGFKVASYEQQNAPFELVERWEGLDFLHCCILFELEKYSKLSMPSYRGFKKSRTRWSYNYKITL